MSGFDLAGFDVAGFDTDAASGSCGFDSAGFDVAGFDACGGDAAPSTLGGVPDWLLQFGRRVRRALPEEEELPERAEELLTEAAGAAVGSRTETFDLEAFARVAFAQANIAWREAYAAALRAAYAEARREAEEAAAIEAARMIEAAWRRRYYAAAVELLLM